MVFAINPSDVTTSGLDLTTPPLVKTVWKAGNGYVAYDPETKTLTLNNATIAKIGTTDDKAINGPGVPVTIEVKGTNNNLKSTLSGIYNDNSITIQGAGTLNV